MSDNCKEAGTLVFCVVFFLIRIVYQSEGCVRLKDRKWNKPGRLPGLNLSICMKAKQGGAEREHSAKQNP